MADYVWDGSEDWSGKVFKGNFEVDVNVTSLKGCPKEVTGDFDCSRNNNLITLEGAPEKVGGMFDCHGCENLETLKGAPKKVGNGFYCYGCDKLKNLKGGPEYVDGHFYCDKCANLESLEGAPEKDIYDFDCSRCPKLKSLKGISKKIISLNCSYCENLESLEDCPEIVEYFDCSGCKKLKSLKGAPKEVGLVFNCNGSGIVSLEGGPEKVGYNVDSFSESGYFCEECENLVSLKGIASEIVGDLYLGKNTKLNKIDDFPIRVTDKIHIDKKNYRIEIPIEKIIQIIIKGDFENFPDFLKEYIKKYSKIIKVFKNIGFETSEILNIFKSKQFKSIKRIFFQNN